MFYLQVVVTKMQMMLTNKIIIPVLGTPGVFIYACAQIMF